MSATIRSFLRGSALRHGPNFVGYLQVHGHQIAKTDSDLWVRREADPPFTRLIDGIPIINWAYVVLNDKFDRKMLISRQQIEDILWMTLSSMIPPTEIRCSTG